MGYLVIYILIYLGAGLGFGFGCRAIARSKGFSDSWFWMGFFLGAVGLIVVACIQPSPSSYSSGYSNGATFSYEDKKPNSDYIGYGGRQVAGNEWRCPKCRTINPKIVEVCSCGCSIEAYNREVKRMAEEAKVKSQENIERAQKEKEEEQKRIDAFKSKYGDIELTATEEMLIKMLNKSETGLSMAEIMRMLPRSANLTSVKEAVSHLTEVGLIQEAEGEKYICVPNNEQDITADSSVEEQIMEKDEVSNEDSIISTNTDSEDYDKYDEIRKCKALLDDGIISPEEFDKKKKELLGL